MSNKRIKKSYKIMSTVFHILTLLEDVYNKIIMNHELFFSIAGRIASIFLLILGVFISDYSFFELIHWIVFLSCGYTGLYFIQSETLLFLIYIGIAIMYNPFILLFGMEASPFLYAITAGIILYVMAKYMKLEFQLSGG